jgi:hypothetical protein
MVDITKSAGLVHRDHGLAVIALALPDGTAHASVASAGVLRMALPSAQSMRGTWQQRECLCVAGPDDREVPAVRRGDPGQPEAPGDGRHSGTGDARRKIKISLRDSGQAAGAGAPESGGLAARPGGQ